MSDQEVKITTSDMGPKEFIVIPKCIASRSVTISNMIEDIPESDESIPLINVAKSAFKLVVEFCEHYGENWPQEEKLEFNDWEKEFFDLTQSDLFDLILAANFLDIKLLLDLSCKTVANLIKGKTPEEIRKTFNIKNDFSPEEEVKIRRENEWCEER